MWPETRAREPPAGTRHRAAAGFGAPPPPLAARLRATGEALAGFAAHDRAAGRGFLWVPVMVAAGVAAYFALPREPALWALAGLALACLLAAWRTRERTLAFPALALAAALCAGATAAKLEVTLVAAPTLDRARTAEVNGFVERVERRTGGRARLTIRPVTIERVPAARLPRRITVTAAGAASLLPGDGVSLTARLEPPRGPDMPGGWNPARSAYLDGIGASGFAYGRPQIIDLGAVPWSLAPARAVAEVRHTIAERLRAALPGPRGEVAAALLVGDRGGIPESIEEAMRVSGLAHVLSISGLHMVLVAGTVFWVVRALLAAIPALALTRPIKAWAAVVALIAATFYLVISGAEVATQRAYVTMAVALIAVLVDRPAISLRTVAVAALVVMALEPSAVLGAGFQMSFAAVIALVAAYEWWGSRERGETTSPRRGTAMWLGRAVLFGVAGLAATSLIAGLATAPIAAYHFHRGAPLGLLANLAAMPAVSVLVMPFGVLALVLLPFGLEQLALWPMGIGLGWMFAVAETTTAWTGDSAMIGRVPLVAVLLMVAALLWVAISLAPWRRLAVLPLLAGLALATTGARPDLLVSGDGRAVAARGPDGRLAVVAADRSAYTVRAWLAADADPRDAKATTAPPTRCDDLGCVLPLGDGDLTVAVVTRGVALVEDCRSATVVVAPVPRPAGCLGPQLYIDRSTLARTGAIAVMLDAAVPGGLSDPVTAGTNGRPWSRTGDAVGENPSAPRHREVTAAARGGGEDQ
ncbi:ComEC/Rec2 family competence protein [Pseudoxanthobacter sp. M-2]|uniref:ComEC/Rec2 family competence protein n=1 Tax=Pseudoxanthobacter sp. M-2 TaxID=3078754 RepID=UPI0038FC2FCE